MRKRANYDPIESRKERARNSSMYVRYVEHTKNNERLYYIFSSLKNPEYKVCFSNHVTCSCPDFTSRNIRCKHIYYVMYNFLDIDDNYEDKERFSDNELNKIFAKHNEKSGIFNSIIKSISKILCY